MVSDFATFKDDQVALLVSQSHFKSSVSIMSVLVIRLFQDISIDELKLLQSFKQVKIGAMVVRLFAHFIKFFVKAFHKGEVGCLVNVLKK